MFERRKPFAVDQEKFSTQRAVTYVLLAQFAATAANVFYNNDQSERSMMLQAIISLATFAVGYWLGASKQGQDQAQEMSNMAAAAPAVAAAVVANAAAPSGDIKAATVNVDADTANVNSPKDKE